MELHVERSMVCELQNKKPWRRCTAISPKLAYCWDGARVGTADLDLKKAVPFEPVPPYNEGFDGGAVDTVVVRRSLSHSCQFRCPRR